MKRYLIALIVIVIFGLTKPISVNAAPRFNLESVEQYCYCVSSKDTNNQKKHKNIKKAYNRLYKNGKVLVANVQAKYTEQQSGDIYTKVTFDKTYKASGYQIGYGNQYNESKNKITDRKVITVKRCKYSLKRQVSFVQVRPYRVIKGKRYYGQWSSVYTIGCISKEAAVYRACR